MAEPINFRRDVASPFASAIQGYQLGMGMRQAEEKAAFERQEREFKLQRQQQLSDAFQRLQRPDATGEDYRNAMILSDKDTAKTLQDAFQMRTSEQNETALKKMAPVLFALRVGQNEDAINLLNQEIEANINSNNPQVADALGRYVQILETGGPEAADVVREAWMGEMSFIPGADKVIKNINDVAEGERKRLATPEAPTRLVTRADRARFAAEGTPLPDVPLQIDGKGKISEVTKGPMVQVAIDQSQRDTLALKELDIPRAKEFSDAAASARKLAQDSRVISNLLKGKGGGAAVKMSTDLARSLGFETETVTANDLVNALATRGAVQIRAPGSGATSDLEFKSYLQAFPSLSNSDSGRQLMAKYAEAFAKRSARLADHSRKLIREDRYSEEEIARFDESLGPVLDEDFYNFARSAGPRRPGVSQYPGRETPQRPAAPVPVNPARGGAVFLGFE
jgi:hypothetical protein